MRHFFNLESIKTILEAAGQFYDLTPSAQKVLYELIDGETKVRNKKFTDIRYGKLHFQEMAKLSEAGVEDAWKLLDKKKMIGITPRPGETHLFSVNPLVYDFCVQLYKLNFHVNPKKYLKEVMEGLAQNPLFLIQKLVKNKAKKNQKVPPLNPEKVPPTRTSSLVGLRSRVRIPDLEIEKPPEIPKIKPIVEGLPFFTDYEKYRISEDYEYDDILEAKRDMDNYQHKFMKTINSAPGYFIDALNRQKRRRLNYEYKIKKTNTNYK